MSNSIVWLSNKKINKISQSKIMNLREIKKNAHLLLRCKLLIYHQDKMTKMHKLHKIEQFKSRSKDLIKLEKKKKGLRCILKEGLLSLNSRLI